MKMPNLASSNHCGTACRRSDSVVGWYGPALPGWSAGPLPAQAKQAAARSSAPRPLPRKPVGSVALIGIVLGERNRRCALPLPAREVREIHRAALGGHGFFRQRRDHAPGHRVVYVLVRRAARPQGFEQPSPQQRSGGAAAVPAGSPELFFVEPLPQRMLVFLLVSASGCHSCAVGLRPSRYSLRMLPA